MKAPKIKLNGISALNSIGLIVAIYLVVVLASTIKKNYDLGRQIDDLGSQITLLQEQKDQLSYDIQYYGTDAFRGREARSKLGLQLPGENVVIIPRPSATPAPAAAKSKAAPRKSNLQQWFDFLTGRNI